MAGKWKNSGLVYNNEGNSVTFVLKGYRDTGRRVVILVMKQCVCVCLLPWEVEVYCAFDFRWYQVTHTHTVRFMNRNGRRTIRLPGGKVEFYGIVGWMDW